MDKLGDDQQLYFDVGSMPFPGQRVKFWAEDPAGKHEILLDGKKAIHAIPGLHCDHIIHVTVTSRPKIRMSYTYLKALIFSLPAQQEAKSL